mmetsp:Transcript_153834/g.491708  ORF Transcript_153834/g.491708 Transcript_153834/m.491708 type:complete len:218 (+) Transcript_153834:176-829(+)
MPNCDPPHAGAVALRGGPLFLEHPQTVPNLNGMCASSCSNCSYMKLFPIFTSVSPKCVVLRRITGTLMIWRADLQRSVTQATVRLLKSSICCSSSPPVSSEPLLTALLRRINACSKAKNAISWCSKSHDRIGFMRKTAMPTLMATAACPMQLKMYFQIPACSPPYGKGRQVMFAIRKASKRYSTRCPKKAKIGTVGTAMPKHVSSAKPIATSTKSSM